MKTTNRLARALRAHLLPLASLSLMALPTVTHAQVPAPAAAAASATDKKGIEQQEAFAVIDAWLKTMAEFRKVPGLSAGVVSADRLIWSAGYGHVDAAGRMPATPTTPTPSVPSRNCTRRLPPCSWSKQASCSWTRR